MPPLIGIGCRPNGPDASSHVLPVTARGTLAPSLTAAGTNGDDRTGPIAQVRQRPLFKAAEQACKAKQYARASDLLIQPSKSVDLTSDQIEFCSAQANICRQDGHLTPLPVAVSASHLALQTGSKTKYPVPNTQYPSPETEDCGPRAMAIVCGKLGIHTDIAALRKAAGTTAKGTSMEGLAVAARSVGLKAEGIQVGRDGLAGIHPPAISWWLTNHYVALLSLSGKGDTGTATIRDPNVDHDETLQQEVFLRRSAGYVLLIRR